MVHLFLFFFFLFSNAFCLAPNFHMASLCAKQQKAQSVERIATTTSISNSSIVGALHCSRSGSSTASLCIALGVGPLLLVCALL